MGYFKTVWRHLRRAPFQSLAAVLVVVSNFLVISAFVFLMLSFATVLDYLESRPVIEAFLKDGFEQTEVEELMGKIREIEGVRQVRFISKEEALKIYREDNKDDPLLLEMVTAEILPASIEVSAEKPAVLQRVAEELKKKEGLFLEISFQKDIVERLTQLVILFEKVGIFLISFLTLTSFFIIMVITGMKVTLRKKEIGVLKLLGAGNFYIYFPFVLEGIWYGFLGAVIGWGVVFFAGLQIRSRLAPFFGNIPFYPPGLYPYLLVLALEAGGGVLVGLVSAFLAVRRHLKK